LFEVSLQSVNSSYNYTEEFYFTTTYYQVLTWLLWNGTWMLSAN